MAEKESVLKLFDFPTYGEHVTSIFLPYFGRFPEKCNLKPGSEVVVTGRPFANSNGFSINLAMPPLNSEFNCALHFNPRFDENRVVRDHRPNGHWTQKEDYGGFPFRADKKFTLLIQVLSAGYKIFVDGRHFCDFHHYVHPSKVTHIGMTGHLSVSSLEVRFDKTAGKAENNAAKEEEIKEGQTTMISELQILGDSNTYGATGDNIILPYYGQLPEGCMLQPGSQIVFMGRPFPGRSEGFSINLAMPPPTSSFNCTMHFNPRFNEKTVVRNCRIEGQWGKREDYGGFPFKQDEEFKVVIEVHKQGYKVYVDDVHFCDYHPPCDSSKVKYIAIRGFVSVMILKVQLDKTEPKWTSLKGQTVAQVGE